MYGLAEHLHKTVDEIAGMSTPEFIGWRAYFDVLAYERELEAAEREGKNVWIRPPWEVTRNG